MPTRAKLPLNTVRFDGECPEAGANAFIHIMGVAFGLEALGVESSAFTIVYGQRGKVSRAAFPCHGLLRHTYRGKTIFATDSRDELVTPTGAALIHALADKCACGPQGTVAALGTGYGLKFPGGGLRAWLVEPAARGADHSRGGTEAVVQFESHIDHLNGEDLGAALTALSAMPEVLDVLWLPGVGKKNRPAGLLRVLCLPGSAPAVWLSHTAPHLPTPLAYACSALNAWWLRATPPWQRWRGSRLPAKEYVIEGQTYIRPEADALEAAARQRGVGVPALRNGRWGCYCTGFMQGTERITLS